MTKVSGLITFALVAVFWIGPANAQQAPSSASQPGTPQPQRRAPGPPQDPLINAFSPEMIMQHQRELGLTDQQKTYMRTEISKTSSRFSDLQWQLHEAMEALHETMRAQIVNEQQALMQLDKVLENEREIKRLHMELAIKIKNNLTPEQQQKLQNMRHGRGAGMGVGHGPGGGAGMGVGHGPGDGPGGPSPQGRPSGPGVGPGGTPPPRPPRPNF